MVARPCSLRLRLLSGRISGAAELHNDYALGAPRKRFGPPVIARRYTTLRLTSAEAKAAWRYPIGSLEDPDEMGLTHSDLTRDLFQTEVRSFKQLRCPG
jgi:hypothetical protein